MIHPCSDTPRPTIGAQIQVIQGIEVPQPDLAIPRARVCLFRNHRCRRNPVNSYYPRGKQVTSQLRHHARCLARLLLDLA